MGVSTDLLNILFVQHVLYNRRVIFIVEQRNDLQ